MPISIFGFPALWSPYYLAVLVLITILYFMLTIKWKDKFKDSEPLKTKEAILFVSGMVLLYIIKGSPTDLLGHIIFSMHMVQMAFLLLLVPPLLIMGVPSWVWRKFINFPVVKPLFHFFTKPMLALILFGLVFSFYHIPLVFDFVKTSTSIHAAVNGILFISAIFYWWPVVNNLEGSYKFHGLKKLGYLFGLSVLMTPACALIIFSSSPFYATYSDGEAWLQAMALCVPAGTLSQLNLSGPELFTNMSTVEDQRTGGIVMKVLQELVFTVFLWLVFYEWLRNENDNADEITAKSIQDRKNMAYHRHNA
ncbi:MULTISPECIES: cytochrome c oxidase assembly factor CtaG [unclassified Planococcus (in: firmicutes)]|uniref:cytochrome c oxidase assembly factor CtaG n=1 Tax=unclassified Planococcus (in: firmicutes) TaxID=2662419 RepID=UPI001F20547B|nr:MULTISPECIES: cytochrome c oxidase assembly factor CtaG [unclassified Planococcus (in: firmicutes)]UJF25849.1 cytochrome c oxidase assembly factor CtaG [Planococcus sp. 107-1]GKW44985.1 protein CtaG [Planococcus sp. NCCP-2050]